MFMISLFGNKLSEIFLLQLPFHSNLCIDMLNILVCISKYQCNICIFYAYVYIYIHWNGYINMLILNSPFDTVLLARLSFMRKINQKLKL